MDALTEWGLDVVVAFQRLQSVPGLTPAMQFFTFLGLEEFFLLLMPFLFWSVNAPLGARMAVILVTSNGLNYLLQLGLHSPRPYWLDSRVQALVSQPTYGLPSNHAQNATALWGFLASQAGRNLRRFAIPLAAVLIVLISISRWYLGAHLPTHTLLGWIVGGAVLWAFLAWERPAGAWLARLSLGQQIGLAFALALFYLAATGLIHTLLLRDPDPPEWETTAAAAYPPEVGERAIDPRAPEDAFTNAGLLFGVFSALACQARFARFNAGGRWTQRVLRYVIGAIGMLVFWRGLALVFPTEPLALGLGLRFARYALTTFWALFLAPLVFLRTGLAQPTEAPGQEARLAAAVR